MKMTLRELRKKKGVTQKELSSALHVSINSVVAWELGRSLPQKSALKKLAEYFGETPEFSKKNYSIEKSDIDMLFSHFEDMKVLVEGLPDDLHKKLFEYRMMKIKKILDKVR